MKKRYHIYLHENWSASVDVIANSVTEARDAVRQAFLAGDLSVNFGTHEEADVDEDQFDEGDEHLDYADYEVNEDGELVEVEG